VLPEIHVCAPVSLNQIEKMSWSLTYSTYFKKYLLVGQTGKYDPARGAMVWGFYYSTSNDLVSWSPRRLLMEAEMIWTFECGDPEPVAYPALLDPSSTSRNFDTTDQNVYLYFTLLHRAPASVGCRGLRDRDLVRIPIEFVH
jgi:hypothetical protein